MAFYGADTQQLRSSATLLRDRAKSLSALRDKLNPQVMNPSSWQGPDADDFRQRWTAHASPSIEQTSHRLLKLGDDLDQQADEQDEASGAGQGPSIWDRIKDGLKDLGKGVGLWFRTIGDGINLYNNLQGIFGGAKQIWDSIKKFPTKGAKWAYEEITDGFSSLASKIAGKLGLPTDFGPKNFFDKLDDFSDKTLKWAKKMPWLTKAGRIAGRVVPFLDVAFGGWQMIDSIGKGDTFHAITGGAQTLGGGLLAAGTICDATGVGAVVGVPLQIAGGILVGGAAIADAGKWVYDNWDGIKDNAKEAWDWTTDKVEQGGEALGKAKDWAGKKLNDAKDAVGDFVSDGFHAVFG